MPAGDKDLCCMQHILSLEDNGPGARHLGQVMLNESRHVSEPQAADRPELHSLFSSSTQLQKSWSCFVSCCAAYENTSGTSVQSWENIRRTRSERLLTDTWWILFKTVKVMKNKERLRSYYQLQENRRNNQMLCETLHSILEQKKIVVEALVKYE